MLGFGSNLLSFPKQIWCKEMGKHSIAEEWLRQQGSPAEGLKEQLDKEIQSFRQSKSSHTGPQDKLMSKESVPDFPEDSRQMDLDRADDDTFSQNAAMSQKEAAESQQKALPKYDEQTQRLGPEILNQSHAVRGTSKELQSPKASYQITVSHTCAVKQLLIQCMYPKLHCL